MRSPQLSLPRIAARRKQKGVNLKANLIFFYFPELFNLGFLSHFPLKNSPNDYIFMYQVIFLNNASLSDPMIRINNRLMKGRKTGQNGNNMSTQILDTELIIFFGHVPKFNVLLSKFGSQPPTVELDFSIFCF